MLVDTDVFVDHIRGARSLPPERLAYSIVTRAELFAGRPDREAHVEAVLALHRELPVDRPVAERAGRLRRQHGLALPDALIAATALEHRLALVTRNVRHFGRVPDLELVDRP